jgi:hypothetical protein
MQKNFFNYPLYLSLIGTFFGLIFYLFNLIEDSKVISYALFLLGFLATGISLAMLKNATLRIQQVASISGLVGFTLWLLSVFHTLPIRSMWAISLSLIAFSLILGMYSLCNFSKGLQIFAQLVVVSLSLFLLGVIFKIDAPLFYSFGIVILGIFSILTFIGVFSSQKKATL